MLEWRFDNQWSKIEMLTINFRAIRLLEVLKLLVHLSVFLLLTTWGPRYERRCQEVLLYQEFLRGGEILTTFLT